MNKKVMDIVPPESHRNAKHHIQINDTPDYSEIEAEVADVEKTTEIEDEMSPIMSAHAQPEHPAASRVPESPEISTAPKKAKKTKKRWSTKKKLLVWIPTAIFGIALILAIIVGTYAMNVLNKATTVFEGSPLDILTPATLKEDANGYTNVLIFGTSEDEEGHGGALLADSIMVLSVDQDTKKVANFSIPRDLWVDYGRTCSVGNQGKINAGYLCALEALGNDKKAAGADFANLVGRVVGLEIPYFMEVNWTVVREVTNALGGIDVDVHSSGNCPGGGIIDNNMHLTLPDGVSHLDGETALKLARARNSHGGCGLSRSNFDREINQQRILKAMQKKALNLGILADPGKVMSIMDALGSNVSTNVTMSELRTGIDIAGGMTTDIIAIDTSGQFTTGAVGAASVVLPKAGQGNYTELQAYIIENLKNTLSAT